MNEVRSHTLDYEEQNIFCTVLTTATKIREMQLKTFFYNYFNRSPKTILHRCLNSILMQKSCYRLRSGKQELMLQMVLAALIENREINV